MSTPITLHNQLTSMINSKEYQSALILLESHMNMNKTEYNLQSQLIRNYIEKMNKEANKAI